MKKIVRNPLIILAAGLVVVGASSVGATRAAVTYSEGAEQVDFSTSKLSVDLRELQGDDYVSISGDKGLTFPSIAEDGDNFKIGKKYSEDVKIVNDSTGTYDEYVRVVVRKSWKNADGSKSTVLNPEHIELGTPNGWISGDKTEEQEVFYYTAPLAPGDEVQFVDSITISNNVLSFVKNVEGDTAGTVVNEYKYDGKIFSVELKVDAVQAHNAEEAILGAWGVKATVDEAGNITSIGN